MTYFKSFLLKSITFIFGLRLSSILISVNLLIFIFVIIKCLLVINLGNNIGAEFVGPTRLSPLGLEALQDISNNNMNPNYNCVHTSGECGTTELENSSRTMRYVWDYIHMDADFGQRNFWIMENGLSLTDESIYRGRIIHHYSTITFPYFLWKRDGFFSIIAAQYGALAIAPLWFFKGLGFQYYSSIQWMLLFFIITVVIIFNILKKSENNSIYFVGVTLYFFILSSCFYELGVYMSPGFAPIRYLPLVFLVEVLLYGKCSVFSAILFISLIFLNSVSFNILLLIAIIASVLCQLLCDKAIMKSFNDNKSLRFNIIMAIILFVEILIQLYSNTMIASDFSQSPFSSLSEKSPFTKENYLAFGGTVLVPLLPILYAYFLKKLQFSLKDFFSFLYIICASSYTIRFYNSPQHFVGFMLLASPGYLFLLRKINYSTRKLKIDLLYSGAFFVLLFLTPWFMGYFSLPQKYNDRGNLFFEVQSYGKSISFNLGNDIEKISDEISGLESGDDKGFDSTYFLIREKAIMEISLDKVLNPLNFDPFVDSAFLDIKNVTHLLSKFKYIVTYSPYYVDRLKDFFLLVQKGIGNPNSEAMIEPNGFLLLLEKQSNIYSKLAEYPRQCSRRYCVFSRKYLNPS